MPLRPVGYADLSSIAHLLSRAFKDEYLFSDFMHPHLSQYPNGLYLHFLNAIRISYVSGPDNHLLVSYTTDTNGSETITGFAHWRRLRANPPTSYYSNAMVQGMKTLNYLESFVFPNRAADPARTGVLGEAGPFVMHHWTGTRAEVWDLSILGVDPAFQGRGFGRELVEWGFAKAREEGVGCSVISSDGKDPFYQACGFDVVAGRCADYGGERNPLRDVPGGTIHFWDNGRDVSGVKGYGES